MASVRENSALPSPEKALQGLGAKLLHQVHHLFHQLHRARYVGQGGSYQVWRIVHVGIRGRDAADGRVEIIECFLLHAVRNLG